MAISDEEFFRQIRFNFINPGARSLGFGGAFIALADDATAAQANPAGLMQLAAPEFFIEVRHFAEEDVTGRENIELEPMEFVDFVSLNERQSSTTPTFISYVKPFKKVAIGFSRQEVLNTRISSQTIFGATSGPVFEFAGDGNANLKVTNWNVSLAWRPIPWFSMGTTASLGQMEIDANLENTFFDPTGGDVCATPQTPSKPINCDLDNDGINEPPDQIPALQQPLPWFNTQIADDDTELTYSIGVLIGPSDSYSFGLVYRSDTEYSYMEQRVEGLSGAVIPSLGNPDTVFQETLHLPASYGGGVMWRPNPEWTLTADVVRINYSDLLDGVRPNLNLLAATLGQGEFEFAVDYTMDDVTEVHVGAEHLFAGGKLPWALRLGAHNDPDNVLTDQNGAFGGALGGRDDEMHYTAGAGFVLQEKLQIDVAVSVSDLGNEGIVSGIYRF